jgi:hypothetical protein
MNVQEELEECYGCCYVGEIFQPYRNIFLSQRNSGRDEKARK